MQKISFASFDTHTLSAFAELKIIKFPDLIYLRNCLLINKHFLSESPSFFSNIFILTSNTRKQNTRTASSFDKRNLQYFKIWRKCFCYFRYDVIEFFPNKVFW